jgi:hypothetical protein
MKPKVYGLIIIGDNNKNIAPGGWVFVDINRLLVARVGGYRERNRGYIMGIYILIVIILRVLVVLILMLLGEFHWLYHCRGR